MATRSSILAWEIPWIEEPGGLQSMGSQRDTTEPRPPPATASHCKIPTVRGGELQISTVQIPCPSGANIVVVGK